METRQLTFNRSLTPEQFKEEQGTSKVQILQNPKTSKLFMSWRDARGVQNSGAVSAKGLPTKSPMISEVQNPEDETFWLLHEEGQGGAPVISSF